MCPDYKIVGEHVWGGLAEYVVVPARNLIPVPAHIATPTAAAIPAVYTTAWRGVVTVGQVKPSDRVLVVGASGGLGSAQLMIAVAAGARVAGTASTPSKRAKGLELGAEAMFDSTGDWEGEVSAWAGDDGVDLVLDSVGFPTFRRSLRSLGMNGRLVLSGATGGDRGEISIREIYQWHRRVLGAPMGNWEDFLQVTELVWRGILSPQIHRVYPLEEIAQAEREHKNVGTLARSLLRSRGPNMTTVSLVGDIMIETPLAEEIKDEVGLNAAIAAASQSDVVIGNLEMPLSRRGHPVPKYSNLRSDPDVIEDVKFLGIDAVGLANNHMMDFGRDAPGRHTRSLRQSRNPRAGAGVDIDSALEPTCLAVAGSKIGLLSVACTLPMESDAAVGKPGIAPIHIGFSFEVDTNLLSEQPGTMPAVHSWANADDLERVCTRISAMKEQGDTVIVAIHWGVPNFWLSPAQGLLAEYQQPLGHALIDAGADVIVGTHSHSLHPVEIYRGKPIFYQSGQLPI